MAEARAARLTHPGSHLRDLRRLAEPAIPDQRTLISSTHSQLDRLEKSVSMAKFAECVHGGNSAFCTRGCDPIPLAKKRTAASQPRDRAGEYGFHGGETKQDVMDDICLLLGIPKRSVSRGSSLPAEVFEIASNRLGIPYSSMPDACERIVHRAGHQWSPDFDSRATVSGGGSTVTLEGIQAVRKALRQLL